jgi:catechol 2,3-dioxygenase-like lactoylglutathione lyase family enzyme
MLGSIDHIHIFVDDLEKTIKYFTEILGFRIIRETKHMNKTYELQAPNGNEIIEFGQANENFPAGVDHIAFNIEDLFGTYDVLKAKGGKFYEEPHYVESSDRWLVTMYDAEDRRWIQLVSKSEEKHK